MSNKNITQEEFFYIHRKHFDTFVCLYNEFKKKFYPKQKKEAEKDSSLLSRYIDFKEGFYNKQREEIEKYRSCICKETQTQFGEETEPKKWWLHFYNRVLGIYWRNEGEPRIGIECVFEDEDRDNRLGKFYIYVASWDKPNFGSYKLTIDKYFPNKKERDKKREFRFVAAFAPKQDEAIIFTLKNTYNKLKKIIDEHKKMLK